MVVGAIGLRDIELDIYIYIYICIHVREGYPKVNITHSHFDSSRELGTPRAARIDTSRLSRTRDAQYAGLRPWRLTQGLLLHGREGIHKFLDSMSTRNGGVEVEVRRLFQQMEQRLDICFTSSLFYFTLCSSCRRSTRRSATSWPTSSSP